MGVRGREGGQWGWVGQRRGRGWPCGVGRQGAERGGLGGRGVAVIVLRVLKAKPATVGTCPVALVLQGLNPAV
eukprot:146423-Chlamydomonas_euryale.AAC.4